MRVNPIYYSEELNTHKTYECDLRSNILHVSSLSVNNFFQSILSKCYIFIDVLKLQYIWSPYVSAPPQAYMNHVLSCITITYKY